MSRRDDDLARAIAGFDGAFEGRLVGALATVIADSSRVGNITLIRTGESAGALVTVLASIIALSPSARSPAAIRQTAESFHKKLKAQVGQVERDPLFAASKARCFRDDDRERGGYA